LIGHQHLGDLSAVQEIRQVTIRCVVNNAVDLCARATEVVCVGFLAGGYWVDEDAKSACADASENTAKLA
jgi:hypothetical protein